MELNGKRRCETEVGGLNDRGINPPTYRQFFVYINTKTGVLQRS
jgi:hypothetical protein